MTTNMQQYGYNKHIATKYIFNMYLWNIIDSKARKEKKKIYTVVRWTASIHP